MESQRRPSRFVGRHENGWSKFVLGILAAVGFIFSAYQLWKLVPASSAFSAYSNNSRRSRGSTRRHLDVQAHRTFPAPQLTSLVLVACHSVYTGLDFTHPEDASSWLLLDYQKVPGQTHSFLKHIELGVAHAATDPRAMLLFSGGKTRRDAGPRAEAMGYWLVAEANGWFNHPLVRERAFTEEHARDSFENLLFGLCRYYELTGGYPESIVVVGYEFKRDRFIDLHREAIRWPAQRFEYIGTPALTEDAALGESRTVAAFDKDPYACSGELAAKRASRDPFADGGYSGERCPELAELLQHCGPEVFSAPLPWGDTLTSEVYGS